MNKLKKVLLNNKITNSTDDRYSNVGNVVVNLKTLHRLIYRPLTLCNFNRTLAKLYHKRLWTQRLSRRWWTSINVYEYVSFVSAHSIKNEISIGTAHATKTLINQGVRYSLQGVRIIDIISISMVRITEIEMNHIYG